MPRRSDIKSVCVLGAGPIVIGQGCEFDYSGTQACKALRQEGLRLILINSNPATIMTDPDMADATYIEPLVPEVVEAILRAERPDALLPTLGGQTALNLALALHDAGVLDELGIELLGAGPASIRVAEDREAFKGLVRSLGLEVARSGVARSLDEARALAAEVGIPCVLRPSFTLGGVGGGIVRSPEAFDEMVTWALDQSPVGEVLVEESLLGWKEFEMEVMRDHADMVVIICAIENLDPMGVHTGDSITVAPAQTLTDREYQVMRDASIAIIRGVGVACGGSNIQFAVDPRTGRMVVIEMNPRVSRSSALASKATGFPIARIAALLAIGYTLDELPNEITRETPACFEPTIDYVVTKIPRFAFEKFPEADDTLTTQMKSVGEVMAIGRTFGESLLKALRGLEGGTGSLLPTPALAALPDADLMRQIARPQPDRLLMMAEAFRRGHALSAIRAASAVDPWFLAEIAELVDAEREAARPLAEIDLKRLKTLGFSDRQIAASARVDEGQVRAARAAQGLWPVFKRVDTCAAEFEAFTPYLYSTWERECEAAPEAGRRVMILGSGPNRIGQGIEFDYCCVKASWAARRAGWTSIMVNCNPETVSTDHDTADRLYFEPVDLESVLAIVEVERPDAVIVQFGGQTPLRLAVALAEAGVPVVGTPPEVIEMAEDRERFSAFARRLDLKMPAHRTARTAAEARDAAAALGFPVLVRPSHVLGGRGMAILHDAAALDLYLRSQFHPGDSPTAQRPDRGRAAQERAAQERAALTGAALAGAALERAGQGHLGADPADSAGDAIDPRAMPLLIDAFLDGAVEVDVDALCDGRRVVIGGVMEQIERAGVHSGDSACLLPPATLGAEVEAELRALTRRIALELGVVGLINVQAAVLDGQIFVLEVNPRGSRTVPFVGKVTGVCMATLATQIMLGATLDDLGVVEDLIPAGFACKEVVLPLSRFNGASPMLRPEMRSTGEVMAWGPDPWGAFARAQIAASNAASSGALFIDADPAALDLLAERLDLLDALVAAGFPLAADPASAPALSDRLQRPVAALDLRDEAERVGLAFVAHRDWTPACVARNRRLQSHGVAIFTTFEALEALRRGLPGLDFAPRPIQR